MKNIGKPCAGEPHARFDEGGDSLFSTLPWPRQRMISSLVLISTEVPSSHPAEFGQIEDIRPLLAFAAAEVSGKDRSRRPEHFRIGPRQSFSACAWQSPVGLGLGAESAVDFLSLKLHPASPNNKPAENHRIIIPSSGHRFNPSLICFSISMMAKKAAPMPTIRMPSISGTGFVPSTA